MYNRDSNSHEKSDRRRGGAVSQGWANRVVSASTAFPPRRRGKKANGPPVESGRRTTPLCAVGCAWWRRRRGARGAFRDFNVARQMQKNRPPPLRSSRLSLPRVYIIILYTILKVLSPASKPETRVYASIYDARKYYWKMKSAIYCRVRIL